MRRSRLLRAQRVAAVREGDDDAVPRAHEARELVLGLGQPARGHGRTEGVERERLAAREGVELGRALEGHLRQALLAPHRAHALGLPDEVGSALEGRDEVVGRAGGRAAAVLVVSQRGLVGVDGALGGRVDDGFLDRVQRPLREGREGAHRLDLVAEELDPERLPAGRGEDVEEPAAHGDLATVVDPFHPLVPRAHERASEPLRAVLLADA